MELEELVLTIVSVVLLESRCVITKSLLSIQLSATIPKLPFLATQAHIFMKMTVFHNALQVGTKTKLDGALSARANAKLALELEILVLSAKETLCSILQENAFLLCFDSHPQCITRTINLLTSSLKEQEFTKLTLLPSMWQCLPTLNK